MNRLVGEKKKRQCPVGMGACVRADCMWWCNGACVVVNIAEAVSEARQ